MYDVIVIGARCAGSPLAMLLARRGHRVLVVDRATFPSDTMSTHAMKKPAGARLAKWGLLDRVAATGCPPFVDMRLSVGPLVLSGHAPAAGDVDVTYAPRRIVLDKILFDAAVEAGAEVRDGVTVDELLFDDDTVVGIRAHDKQGMVMEERATIVVGADGRHSFVARAMHPPMDEDRGTLSCWYYAYWADLPMSGVEFALGPGRLAIGFPTNDDRTLVAVAWPIAEAAVLRADIEGGYMATVGMFPELAERVHSAKRDGHFVGTNDLPNFIRRPFGPGWALAGDAGYHKDPVTAEGISNAFRDADLLSDAIDAGLTGQRPMSEALADFERVRNEQSMPLFELTCQLGALAPPDPGLLQLLGALPGNQADTDAFFGVIEGTTPVAEFFAPANVGRIIASA